MEDSDGGVVEVLGVATAEVPVEIVFAQTVVIGNRINEVFPVLPENAHGVEH